MIKLSPKHPVLSFLSCLAIAMAIAITLPSRSTAGPNVVLIVADDLGYGDTRVTDPNAVVPTPNITSIANQGVKFTNGYVASPVCSPSRAGLMTSIHPARYGAENNSSSRNRPGRMPATTIASLLKAKSYATKIVGKWDLAGQAPQNVNYMPVARGFNGFYGIPGGISSYYLPSNPPAGAWCLVDGTATQNFSQYNGPSHNVQEYNSSTHSYDAIEPTEYLTGKFADEAVAFIDAHSGGSGDRFFLYLPFNATHTPYMAPDAYYGPASGSSDAQRMYRAMIANLDANVGKVLTALGNKSQTVQDNTMIIFISDNGNTGQGSSGPLSGGKQTLYEGGLHVPFAIKWPAVLSPGQYTYPVSTLDLLPTIAKAAGYTAGQFATEGVDLAPFVTTQSGPAHASLNWRYVGDDANQAGEILAMLGVRNGNFKYLRHVTVGGTTTEHLYDLGTSLVESGANDLIGNSSYATDKAACITALHNWNKQNPLDEGFGNLAYGFVPYYSQSGGTWSIVGNEYQIADGHAGDRSIVETTYFEDATFQVDARLTTNGKAGLIFRSSNHSPGGSFFFNGYFAQIEAGDQVSLYRVDNGSQALLGVATKTIALGTTYALKVVTAGTNIKVYVGSTKYIDVNDSTYAGGSVGVRLGTPTSSSTATAVFDDLVVTPQ